MKKYKIFRWRAHEYEDDLDNLVPFKQLNELTELLLANGYSKDSSADLNFEFVYRWDKNDERDMHVYSVSTEGPKDNLYIHTGENHSTRKKITKIYSVNVETNKFGNFWLKTSWQSGKDGRQIEPNCNKYMLCNGYEGLVECLIDFGLIK